MAKPDRSTICFPFWPLWAERQWEWRQLLYQTALQFAVPFKMDRREDVLSIWYAYSVLSLIAFYKIFRQKRPYMRKILQGRERHGVFTHLVPELQFDQEYHRQYFRITATQMEELICVLGPRLARGSNHKLPISPAMRIAMTLRYLASGDSQASVAIAFRVSRPSMCFILRETCQVIWEVLRGEYLKRPSQQQDWETIAQDFLQKWHFPHCIGALDGKHISMQAPPKSGSEFFNYKKFHSIILMAACDANYCFTLVDIGSAGRLSDGGAFSKTRYGKMLQSNEMNLPEARPLPNTRNNPAPFVFVADEAFPLKTYLMRPYPKADLDETKRVFNYRLSRARRIIENAFGILAARWRIFKRPIVANLCTVKCITKACVVLHNYLKKQDLADVDKHYCPPGFLDSEDGDGNVVPGDWRREREQSDQQALSSVGRLGSNTHSGSAANVRTIFADYFMSPEGELSWQYELV